jgi:hypothetical protein
MLFNPMNRVHTHPHFVFGSPSWQSLHVSICLHFSYKVDVFVTHSDWLQLSLTAFVKNCHRVTMKIKLMLPRVKIQGDGSYSLVCEDVYCEVIGDLFIYIWGGYRGTTGVSLPIYRYIQGDVGMDQPFLPLNMWQDGKCSTSIYQWDEEFWAMI